jgi:hypothetical protein
MTSSSLSLRPTAPPSAPQDSQDQRYNLQLGGLSLSVAPPDLNRLSSNPALHRAGNTLEAGVDGATNLARNVFGRLIDRVQSGV